jgi:hypothetical protein
MLIEAVKLSKENKIALPDLITRPVGRKFFSSAGSKLDIIGSGETLVIDFGGIKVMDSSFIDESIVKLILLSREPGKPFFVKIKNISRVAEINIDLVFNSYTSYNNTRIAVITDTITSGNKFFIGSLKKEESDILEYIRVSKSASAGEVASAAGLDKKSGAETVDMLYSLRLIKINGETCEAV